MHVSVSRKSASVTRIDSDRLAAAVCLHTAVALELVAGQTWATLQPVQDCGTRCPGGTTPGSGPSGQLVVRPRLLGELGRCPVLRIRAHRHPLKDGEGGQRAGLGRPGQTSARDKPPDNLMPRAVLRWLDPHAASN